MNDESFVVSSAGVPPKNPTHGKQPPRTKVWSPDIARHVPHLDGPDAKHGTSHMRWESQT